MPWACNNFTPQFALAQRTAAMKADIVDSKELAINVGQRDDCAFKLKLLNRAWRHFFLLGRPQECHRRNLLFGGLCGASKAPNRAPTNTQKTAYSSTSPVG